MHQRGIFACVASFLATCSKCIELAAVSEYLRASNSSKLRGRRDVRVVALIHECICVFDRYLKEFDVTIDSQLLVLSAILKWCKQVTNNQVVPEGKRKRIAFHTTNSTFFNNLQLLLESFDYDLQDSVEVQHFEEALYNVSINDDGVEDEERPPLWVDTSIPHLVYHETSAESVIETKHLLSAGLVDPALCCVLIDSFDEYQLIQNMIEVRSDCHR